MWSTYISRADGDIVPDSESGLMPPPQAKQSNPTDNYTLEKSPHAYSMPEEIATARRHRELEKGKAKQTARPFNTRFDLAVILIPVSAYTGGVLSRYLSLNTLSVETKNTLWLRWPATQDISPTFAVVLYLVFILATAALYHNRRYDRYQRAAVIIGVLLAASVCVWFTLGLPWQTTGLEFVSFIHGMIPFSLQLSAYGHMAARAYSLFNRGHSA